MVAQHKHKKELDLEINTSDFIPYGNHVTKNTIKLVTGDYLQVIRLQGAAHESADAADINLWHENLNNFLRNIAAQDMAIWSHVIRREFNEYPAGEFENTFCKQLNSKYKAHMTESRMLVNELYLSIVYRPSANNPMGALSFLKKKSAEEISEEQAEHIEAIDDVVEKSLSSLNRYLPKVLGCYEHKGIMFSEVQEFLAFLVDGEWRRQPITRAEIKDCLCTARPFFGKGGLLTLKGPAKVQYGAAVVIEAHTSQTYPGMLNALLGVPFEFVLSQSFTFISKTVALNRMRRQQSRMVNAGDLAASQITDIDDALDDIQSNRYVLGTHHLALFPRADDQKRLNEYVSIAGTIFSEAGMKYTREDAGLAGSFWAQLPGNFAYRVRAADVTSRNFAAFSSFHNYPLGRIKGAQWGDALTSFKTASDSPFYFSFHRVDNEPDAKVDINHKELASTAVIGQAGSGKTVLEMFLLSQAQKFRSKATPMTSILFDKDRGAYVGVLAMGGKYYSLKNGEPSGFNPFQLDPTPANITFLESFVKVLVTGDNYQLSPSEYTEIVTAIAGVMSAPKEARRLSSVLEYFDSTDTNGIYARLAPWCEGGNLAWLFDNDEDHFAFDNDTPIYGFDVTHFIANEQTRTPTIMYLLHRIESLLDGRRLPIFMDEFGQLLKGKAFEKFAEDKLVTIRKMDGFLVMFTQSPKQVLSNPISYAIIEQTATKIFLPNPSADYDDYVNGFKLTRAEYDIIKKLPEKSRSFLIKQNGNSVVAELNLRGFNDELAVLSSNPVTVRIVENLIAKHGSNPDVWLPEFQRVRQGVVDDKDNTEEGEHHD